MNLPEKRLNILVVDDDPVHLKLVETNLEDHGFVVVTSSEAATGLQIAMKDSPDLIILDVMMPIINGYNFCRLLKSEEKQKNIPIIMLTSRDEEEDIEIGMEMGADAYLTKPLNMESLMSTIRTLINSKRTE